MRSQFEMPTMPQVAKLVGRSTAETLKAMKNSGFHYFTSTEKPFYATPTSSVMFEELPKIPTVYIPKAGKISDDSQGRMRDWASTYGKSVRQHSVKSLST